MVIALDPRGTYDYVHPFDRDLPEERQTVFVMGVLTLSERDVAMKMLEEVARHPASAIRQTMAVLRIGVVNIRNLIAPDGTIVDVTFAKAPSELKLSRADVIADETWKLIPPEYYDALLDEIMRGASVNEADRKK